MKAYMLPLCPSIKNWGPNIMAAIFQTAFSNAFSWIKIYQFRILFHWSLFPSVQLTIFQHWFRHSLATSHYLKQLWSVYWRTDVSPDLSELRYQYGLSVWHNKCYSVLNFNIDGMYLVIWVNVKRYKIKFQRGYRQSINKHIASKVNSNWCWVLVQ